MLCPASTPPDEQIEPGRPSRALSLLGLSPSNPLSGERSRGPPALDRKLSAPLAPRASSFTAGKAGSLPPAPLLETQPLFPAATPKSLGPGPPRGPSSLQISRSGNFPCAVFQEGKAFRTKGSESTQAVFPFSRLFHPPLARGKESRQKSAPTPIWGQRRFGELKPASPGSRDPGGTRSRSVWSSLPSFQFFPDLHRP